MATSGSAEGTYAHYQARLRVDWNRATVNATEGWADINWAIWWMFRNSNTNLRNASLTITGTPSGGGLVWNAPGEFYAYIPGASTNRDVLLATGTTRIYMTADGTSSIRIQATCSASTFGTSTLDTGTITLDAVPRLPSAPGTPSVSGHADADPTTATVTWTSPSNVGSGLTQYQLQIARDAGFTNVAYTTPSGTSWATSFNATGLPKGSTLFARVRAASGAGFGPYSSVYQFTTGTTVPAVPTGLTISGVTPSGANISWTAPTDNGGSPITSYRVQRATNSSFSSGLVETDLPGTTSLNVTGLAPATTYYVRVRATNATGNSSYTATQNFTTGASAPAAPATPTISSITETGATVSYTTPSNGGSAITGYEVQRASDAAFTLNVVTATDSASPYAFTGLTPNRTYYVRVRANNAVGNGAWSNSAQFKTLSGLKAASGSSWVDVTVYFPVGGQWVEVEPHVDNGGAWV